MNAVHHLTQELSNACAQIHLQKNIALRAQEGCQRALSERDTARAQVNQLTRYLDNAKKASSEDKAKLELLEKELHTQKKIAEMRKATADRLESATLGSFGTLYGELSHLRAELKIERDAHNKLKALCNERGFGTPLFYTPPTLPKPEPTWTVNFYQKDIHLGDITYTHAPSAKLLNDLQESLKATSWKLTYRG